MDKNYVVILLFNKTADKLLLVKRNKNPFKNCWNGIGGKINEGETPLTAAIRECQEETNITITNPRHLMTYIYPESNTVNSNTRLNVIYDFIDMVEVPDDREGHYEWQDIDFVMDPFNKEIAGLSNLNQFVKEILDLENIKPFY